MGVDFQFQLAKSFDRPVQQQRDVLARFAQLRCNFLRGEPFEFRKQDHLTVVRRKGVEFPQQNLHGLLLGEKAARRVRIDGIWAGWIGFGAEAEHLFGTALLAALKSRCVHDDVIGYMQQPGHETSRRTTDEFVHVARGNEKDFLQNVVDLL